MKTIILGCIFWVIVALVCPWKLAIALFVLFLLTVGSSWLRCKVCGDDDFFKNWGEPWENDVHTLQQNLASAEGSKENH